MIYISDFREGMNVSGVYLCKSKSILLSKAGKEYASLNLIDKSGKIDAKIWDLNSPGIGDFEVLDYIDIQADVITFNGSKQLNVKRARIAREGEYIESDYLPSSEYDIEKMYELLLKFIKSIKNVYLNKLLQEFFVKDSEFIASFKYSSAARTIHHGFIGGLLEHTLGLTNLCNYLSKAYPIINRDLLITSAILHDIGKIKELSKFPANDYTDEGQLLGHIVIGYSMIMEKAKNIKDFPEDILNQLGHCILSHHGELEYGSPKKPVLVEAMALSLADNLDAKMETMKELLDKASFGSEWLGYNKMFETNIRRTTIQDEEWSNRIKTSDL